MSNTGIMAPGPNQNAQQLAGVPNAEMLTRVVAEKRWQLGSLSRHHPRSIVSRAVDALKAANIPGRTQVVWKKGGQYNLRCKWILLPQGTSPPFLFHLPTCPEHQHLHAACHVEMPGASSAFFLLCVLLLIPERPQSSDHCTAPIVSCLQGVVAIVWLCSGGTFYLKKAHMAV